MSTSFSAITESFRVLADTTAHLLLEKAVTDIELRDALRTVRLGDNAVRIGDYDILAREDETRLYDIRCKHTGKLVVIGLPFYETARSVVRRLNEGASENSTAVRRVVRDVAEYMRSRADIEIHTLRADHYYERGNAHRAQLHENRLSAVSARARVLQSKLLSAHEYR